MHGFTLHQLILEHNSNSVGIPALLNAAFGSTCWQFRGEQHFLQNLVPWVEWELCYLGRDSQSVFTCVSAQWLKSLASMLVWNDAVGTTGQGTGNTYCCCEGYQNASGCCCLQLICQQVSILTLVDTVLHLVDWLWLFSTFNLFYVGLQG